MVGVWGGGAAGVCLGAGVGAGAAGGPGGGGAGAWGAATADTAGGSKARSLADVGGPEAWSAEADATLRAQRAKITLNRKYTPIGRWL